MNLAENDGTSKGDKSGNTFELNPILRKLNKFPKTGKYNIESKQLLLKTRLFCDIYQN